MRAAAAAAKRTRSVRAARLRARARAPHSPLKPARRRAAARLVRQSNVRAENSRRRLQSTDPLANSRLVDGALEKKLNLRHSGGCCRP